MPKKKEIKEDIKSVPELNLIKKVISELNPAPYNPRKISEENKMGLAKSITRFGYIEPIVWNEKTGNIVGGHRRLEALKEQYGDKAEIEVVKVSLSEKDEKILNVSLNNQNIQGEWDLVRLGELLIEIKDEDFSALQLDKLELITPIQSKISSDLDGGVEELFNGNPDTFIGTKQKQIVFLFSELEYTKVLEKLQEKKNELGVQDNSSVLMKLLGF